MGLQMAFRNCKLNTNQKGLLEPYPPLPRHAQALDRWVYRSLA